VDTIVVLGLYSSGSSAVGAVLHHLGVSMGDELFHSHFEDTALKDLMLNCWTEPGLVARTEKESRSEWLAAWMRDRKSGTHRRIGAKHPLLIKSANEIIDAWGESTKFVWSWRDLSESIESLIRRAWFPYQERRMQSALWSEVHAFFESHDHHKVVYQDLLENTDREVDRLIAGLDIHPTDSQVRSARLAVRKP
jgi:hypothetical protein